MLARDAAEDATCSGVLATSAPAKIPPPGMPRLMNPT